MSHVPVQVLGAPLRVEPPLVQVLVGLRLRHVGMRRDTILKVLPHIQHDTFVVPPVNVVFFSLFEILFPSVHTCTIYTKDAERS